MEAARLALVVGLHAMAKKIAPGSAWRMASVLRMPG